MLKFLILSLLFLPGPDAREDRKTVLFSHTEYDFGRVETSVGTLHHSFSFANTGPDTLRLAMPSVSCSCLSADVIPKTLPPGTGGEVRVKLDPSGASGKILRSVGLRTTDGREVATLTLTADAVSAYPEAEALCPLVLSSAVRASVPQVRFGYLYWGETPPKKFFLLANTSSSPVELSVACANPDLLISHPERIAAGQTAEVVLAYRFGREGYRSESDTLVIMLDGQAAERRIAVSCIRMARLPEMNASPVLHVFPSSGKLKRGVSHNRGSVQIRNDGTVPLHIFAVRGTADTDLAAPCTLAPGEQIRVRLRTPDSEARLELFTNDPSRPYKEIIFKL